MKGRNAVIFFLRDCYFGNDLYNQGTSHRVTVLAIGYSGGFERYPHDSTMEGDIYLLLL